MDGVSAATKKAPSGHVALVGAGPGDPDLLTIRAARLIGQAEVVFVDRLVGKGVIELISAVAEVVYVGKSKGEHSVPQGEIHRRMIDAAKAGRRVVRLKGGDPFIFGRGGEELEALRAAAIEVEIVLAQVLGEEKFKKWWSAAKKLIAKDARISVPVKKTECYLIRETPVSAEDELVEQFNGTRSARRRILLAEELVDGSDKATSQKDLAAVLAGLATSVQESNQLDAAERLYGAAIRDDLAKLVGSETVYEPTQASLIANQRDLPEIAEKIPVHFQSRFLELILATHPIETRDIVFGLLKVSQGKFTTECINFLVEQGYSDDLAATLTRWQTEQNLRAPVLLWIVKNRHSKKFAKLLNDLITPRLLSAVGSNPHPTRHRRVFSCPFERQNQPSVISCKFCIVFKGFLLFLAPFSRQAP